MGLIEQAAAFSKEKHDAGRPRKFIKRPYFVHPEAAANRLQMLLDADVKSGKVSQNDFNAIIAATYLHDVVEDCGVPIQEIKDRFGSSVAEMVAELTSEKKTIETMMREKKIDKHQAKGIYLSKEINHMTPHTRQIKLADREDNLKDLAELDKLAEHRAWVHGYARETKYILDHIVFAPNSIEQELISSIQKLIAPFLNEK